MRIEKINTESGSKYDELKALWCEVFGDEPSYVDSVYSSLDAIGWILAEDDKVVSALTTFEVGTLTTNEVETATESDNSSIEPEGLDKQENQSIQSIICVYAVCTAPEFRGNGYASELVRAAVADIEASGKRALVSPASPTLQNYYADFGFTPTCYAQQKTLTLNEQDEFCEEDFDEEEGIFIPDMQIKLQTIDAATYGEYREKFLGNSNVTISEKNPSNSETAIREGNLNCDHIELSRQFPYSNHIILSRQFLDFILSDSYEGQGMLLVNDGDAICVLNGCDDVASEVKNSMSNCELTENNMHITLAELIINPVLAELSSEIDEQLTIGIAELLEADSITYRMPAMTDNFEIESDIELGENSIYVQAMLSGNEEIRELYFGFPMD